MMERYFEDLAVGQMFRSGTLTANAQQLREFAAQYDPQPFHLDEAAAAKTFFGRLVASGWQTAGLTMRLLVESELKIVGGLIGAGLDKLVWPNPVVPGDTLRVVAEILKVRPSQSRPTLGIVTMSVTTLNQNDQPVLEFIVNMFVPRRPEGAARPSRN
ncbi:MAG: MaoC family dehydratase [Planctomycetaceae bacterium]